MNPLLKGLASDAAREIAAHRSGIASESLDSFLADLPERLRDADVDGLCAEASALRGRMAERGIANGSALAMLNRLRGRIEKVAVALRDAPAEDSPTPEAP